MLKCVAVLGFSSPLADADGNCKWHLLPLEFAPARVEEIENPVRGRLFASSRSWQMAAPLRAFTEERRCEIHGGVFVNGCHTALPNDTCDTRRNQASD